MKTILLLLPVCFFAAQAQAQPRRIYAVIANGRLFSRADLDALLLQAKEAANAAR